MASGQHQAVLNPPFAPVEMTAIAAAMTDGQLLTRFAARRDEMAEIAFEALVRRHGPMVLRVCHQVVGDRHTAEDAFQATFLILARRAGSIRQPELLGNWLHGVALRTAREARMRDDRRRRRETLRLDRAGEELVARAPRPDFELARREELEALHEEVSRLPERYRIPIVLCDLEGLTQQEAGHRLRCPEGTIGVRLMRARERLRARLTRRGLAPAAGLLGALLCREDASAAMPSMLVDCTVRAALRFGSSSGSAAGLVPGPVFSLAHRVLRTMALSRLKAAMGLALAVAIAASVFAASHRDDRVVAAQEHRETQPDENAPPTRPAEPRSAYPGPRDEPPQPGTPSGPILTDRAVARPSKADAIKGAPAIRNRGERVVKASLGQESEPARDPAPARVRRATPEEQSRGEVLFAREWVPDDSHSHGGDGLGPLYNETSCIACHGLGAPGGAGPENKNVVLVTAVPSGCGPFTSLDKLMPGLRGTRSALLHRYSTDPGYFAWRSRLFDPNKDAQAKTAAKGGEDPVASRIRALRERVVTDRSMLGRNAPSASMNGFNLTLVERNTPPLFGAGRIDEIPSEVLVAMAESQAADVRGRVGRTREGRIGRFGWKAQIPSLHEFVRVACANELGLDVPGHSQAASPLAPNSKAHGLDLTESECDALVSYVRALPAPVVVDPDGPQGTKDLRNGRRLFAEVGCATCHAPTLGDVKGIYSDLLLHDVGQSLSDSGSSYGLDGPDTPKGPSPREWRTPPLWGYRDSGPYLHDGRAQGLEEAVALHDGQARASAHRFFALSWRERSQVESFLKSLVAPSAAAAPGLMLAAELESRLERERRSEPETLVRKQREAAVARDERQWREAKRRERRREAAKRARTKLPLAELLEKTGKTSGAINFYREIARDAAGTDEGRLASERIKLLSTRIVTP